MIAWRALAPLLLCACQPTSQLIVHVDTDAPVPPAPGAATDPMRPPWLFDRLRVELFDRGRPTQARDFELDEGLFQDGKVSFGVAPPVGDGSVTARLRMFRGDHAFPSGPSPTATLETTYSLPAVDSSTVTHVTARLAVSDVGNPLGPIAPELGLPGASMVGSWPGAAVAPCSLIAGDHEVCVPGGAFWMGDPIIKGIVDRQDAERERLVVISPFFIDLHEITVADVRTDLYAAARVTPWNQSSDPSVYDTWCTFTPGPGPQDPLDQHAAFATNCVSYDLALTYCRHRRKTLPSEAQFEFVASGRGLEHAFPWGNDEPSCADAVWGLGGLGYVQFFFRNCRVDSKPIGTRPAGTAARDGILLPDATSGQMRTISDLAGNLSEWMLDGFVDENDPFWAAPGVRTDPVYRQMWQSGVDLFRTTRSGNWQDPAIGLRAGFRHAKLDTDAGGAVYHDMAVGWRCARRGTP